VLKDSPGDKAGLERDDIIVGLEGNKVTNYIDFIEALQAAGPEKQLSLEVIHEGNRKTVQFKLEPCGKYDKWKYEPRAEEAEQRGYPGRVFRMEPGDRQWRRIPFQNMPEDLDRFFHQERIYQIDEGGLKLEIKIEGDPRDTAARITVYDQAKDEKYTVQADKIDDLPDKYREVVRKTLQQARSGAEENLQSNPFLPAPWWDRPDRFKQPTEEPWKDDIEKLERQMQQQMQQMQEQLKQLQEQQKKGKEKAEDM
jgi:hypothetical protein